MGEIDTSRDAPTLASIADDLAQAQIEAMSDEDLLAQINCYDPYDVEFARRYRALLARADAAEAARDREARRADAAQADAEEWARKCAAADDRAEAAEAAARTARDDALEEAATLAETRWHEWNECWPPVVECDASACEEIATAIRALKGDPQ